MLNLISTSSVPPSRSSTELVAVPAPVDTELREMPGWLLLIILSMQVIALILLFQSGFGLIGLGACAMSMSFLISEREYRRKTRETAASQELEDADQQLMRCSEEGMIVHGTTLV